MPVRCQIPRSRAVGQGPGRQAQAPQAVIRKGARHRLWRRPAAHEGSRRTPATSRQRWATDWQLHLGSATSASVRHKVEKDPMATGKSEASKGATRSIAKIACNCHGVFGGGRRTARRPSLSLALATIADWASSNLLRPTRSTAKPTREACDLRKTILYGLARNLDARFEATDVVLRRSSRLIDYMTFLSIRGETERYLIDEAMQIRRQGRRQPPSPKDVVKRTSSSKVTFRSWKEAETQVGQPDHWRGSNPR